MLSSLNFLQNHYNINSGHLLCCKLCYKCLENLANKPQYQELKTQLKQQLFDELKAQGDLRMMGQGEVYEQYPYAESSGLNFYERYMKGEKVKAGWVSPTDFEKGPLD